MSLSVPLLITAIDCDALDKKLQKEKDDLEFRTYQLTRQIKVYQANTVDIAADLVATEGEIASLNIQLATLADGDRKEATITDLDRAKLQLRVQLKRQKDYGVVALVEREVELGMTTAQLEQIKLAVAAVEDRRKEL